MPMHRSPFSVLMNTMESPMMSFFWFMNVLHLMVRRWRRGVPR
jgi:hypothetical protein